MVATIPHVDGGWAGADFGQKLSSFICQNDKRFKRTFKDLYMTNMYFAFVCFPLNEMMITHLRDREV